MQRLIIVSDCTDVAFAEMRGQVFSHCQGVDVAIEPLVPVESLSVLNASFITRLVAEAYPEGSAICVIVNPIEERTERIIARTARKQLLIEGTNNGVLGWALRDLGCAELYELADPGFVPFGGKYVHAPAVGKALSGVRFPELGKPFPEHKVRAVPLRAGTIVHRDNFGNIKFAYEPDSSLVPGARFRAKLTSGMSLEVVFGKRMMDHPTGTWIFYPGSSFDLFEIGQVRGNGFSPADVRVGDQVTLDPL